MSLPAHRIRSGVLQVTIWRNSGERGPWYSVVPTRSYKNGDDTWKETDSLGFDDLRRDPAGLRRRILLFLGADPDAPSGALPPDFNRKEKDRKLPLSDELRAALAVHFAEELKTSARELGGAAATWPERYGLRA